MPNFQPTKVQQKRHNCKRVCKILIYTPTPTFSLVVPIMQKSKNDMTNRVSPYLGIAYTEI